MQLFNWGQVYQDALTTEILRSERRRVTILAGLFAFAACAYTFFAMMPGFLDDEFRVRLQSQWPWFVSLHGVMIAYELTLRAGIGWLVQNRRKPRPSSLDGMAGVEDLGLVELKGQSHPARVFKVA